MISNSCLPSDRRSSRAREQNETMLPAPSENSDKGPARKRPSVGFARQSDVPPSLPSVPRLPPITNSLRHRSIPVSILHPFRRYPSLAKLQNSSMCDYPLLYAATPCFSVLGVRDVAGIEGDFADGERMLPGHLPLRAISSYDWRARIAVPPLSYADPPLVDVRPLPCHSWEPSSLDSTYPCPTLSF